MRTLPACLPALTLCAHLLKQHARAQVRGAFDFAYQQLAAPCGEGESLLSRLIRCSLAASAKQLAGAATVFLTGDGDARMDVVLTERPPPPELPDPSSAAQAVRDTGSAAAGHVNGRGATQRRASSQDKKVRRRCRMLQGPKLLAYKCLLISSLVDADVFAGEARVCGVRILRTRTANHLFRCFPICLCAAMVQERKRRRERDAAFDSDNSEDGQHRVKHHKHRHRHKHKSHIRFD